MCMSWYLREAVAGRWSRVRGERRNSESTKTEINESGEKQQRRPTCNFHQLRPPPTLTCPSAWFWAKSCLPEQLCEAQPSSELIWRPADRTHSWGQEAQGSSVLIGQLWRRLDWGTRPERKPVHRLIPEYVAPSPLRLSKTTEEMPREAGQSNDNQLSQLHRQSWSVLSTFWFCLQSLRLTGFL